MPVAQIRTMEQVLAEGISRQNFNMLLLSIFATIALLHRVSHNPVDADGGKQQRDRGEDAQQ
jgi:predicted ABC-type transport system involved in lysophospholipase L1 biosynthesis ATPase subunit